MRRKMMYFIPLCLSSVIPLALRHHLILQYYQKNFTSTDKDYIWHLCCFDVVIVSSNWCISFHWSCFAYSADDILSFKLYFSLISQRNTESQSDEQHGSHQNSLVNPGAREGQAGPVCYNIITMLLK
jgi:hypothetical protein